MFLQVGKSALMDPSTSAGVTIKREDINIDKKASSSKEVQSNKDSIRHDSNNSGKFETSNLIEHTRRVSYLNCEVSFEHTN